jgi:hypothetical protein
MQQVIVWGIVLVAGIYVLRLVLQQMGSLFSQSSKGCPGCGKCEAAATNKAGSHPPAALRAHAVSIPLQPRGEVRTGKNGSETGTESR